MSNVIFQVIAYSQVGKSSLVGSDKDIHKAWEIARKALEEQADLYMAVTVRRLNLRGGK